MSDLQFAKAAVLACELELADCVPWRPIRWKRAHEALERAKDRLRKLTTDHPREAGEANGS